ncbi:hypothetical protein SLEP1_g35925 [Rubroshorea leprosula]|uniref:Uncharacterized protein n=1 Tax=Rubroshorea leprosula TaxID=152421 RepID=A0AAV5KPT1_9ROSI|nr:hypothetical protein SLEP1_g35925 [Rubroshorea leprosula]
MVSEKFQILIFRFLVVLDVNWISSEPCAFVEPTHECTASVAPRIRVLGRDTE